MSEGHGTNWTLLSGLIAIVVALIILTVCYILSSDAEEAPQDDATTFTPIVSPFVAENAPTGKETEPQEEYPDNATLTPPHEDFVEGIHYMMSENRKDLEARKLRTALSESERQLEQAQEEIEVLEELLFALVSYMEGLYVTTD